MNLLINKRRLTTLIIIFVMFALSGCSRAANISTPTVEKSLPTPSSHTDTVPTEIPLYPSITPFIDQSLNGTKGVTATAITATINPTHIKIPTETPTPTLDTGLFLLQIVSPGQMSKVISPVEFIVHIAPDYTGTTRIELIGEDGAELFRKIFKTYSNLGYYTRIDEKIEFEIRGAAEVARLQVSTFDNNGQMQAFNSVRLLLQGVGENEIIAPTDIQDRVLLRLPNNNDEIGGGALTVVGEFKPADDLPLILELIGEDGTVLGSRILQLAPADGNYQQFATNIPFQVAKKTNARLVIRQSDDRIDGLSYLFSRALVLTP